MVLPEPFGVLEMTIQCIHQAVSSLVPWRTCNQEWQNSTRTHWWRILLLISIAVVHDLASASLVLASPVLVESMLQINPGDQDMQCGLTIILECALSARDALLVGGVKPQQTIAQCAKKGSMIRLA
jgi:hypothetical protein